MRARVRVRSRMHCVCAWPRRGYKWAAQTAAFLCVVLRTELLSSAGLLGGHLARSRPTFLPTPPARPAVRVSGPLPAFLPGGERPRGLLELPAPFPGLRAMSAAFPSSAVAAGASLLASPQSGSPLSRPSPAFSRAGPN